MCFVGFFFPCVSVHKHIFHMSRKFTKPAWSCRPRYLSVSWKRQLFVCCNCPVRVFPWGADVSSEDAASSWFSLLTSCGFVLVPAGCVAAQPAKPSRSDSSSLISTPGESLCSLTLKKRCNVSVTFSLLHRGVISFWNECGTSLWVQPLAVYFWNL